MHSSLQSVARRSPQGAAAERGFAALLLGMLLAQLDTNVVVAALPRIGAELGGRGGVAGVTAGYLLAVTVSTPVYGKLGDLLGRRAVFAGALGSFAVGSVLCALAPSMPALIGARAVQGLGGGGLIVTAVSALGEMFDHAERVRRQIWLTGVFAVSSLAGPPLGGFVAAEFGWEWIFLANPPICAAALALGARGLPHLRGEAPSGFDVASAALIVVGGGCLVAVGAFDAMATSPVWSSLLVLTAVTAAVVLVRTTRAKGDAALIPPRVFAVPALARSIVATGCTGVALFGTFAFVPLALTAGVSASPAHTGGLLLALTGGQLLIVTTFAVLARRYPAMTPWARLALVLGITGLGILAAVPHLSGTPPIAATSIALGGMTLTGAALGLSMQAYTLLGQASSPSDVVGSAMATLTFARQLGGSLGAAALGWLLLTVPHRPTALTVIFGGAAAVLTVGLFLTPRRRHEPEHRVERISIRAPRPAPPVRPRMPASVGVPSRRRRIPPVVPIRRRRREERHCDTSAERPKSPPSGGHTRWW